MKCLANYVSAKDCPQWLWLAIERHTGLVAGFPIEARDEESALGLWLSISEALRTHALVFTDNWPVYAAVLQKGNIKRKAKSRPPEWKDSTIPCASAVAG